MFEPYATQDLLHPLRISLSGDLEDKTIKHVPNFAIKPAKERQAKNESICIICERVLKHVDVKGSVEATESVEKWFKDAQQAAAHCASACG